ncbi:MAG: hypothetical protein IPH95_01055 [Candidatus Promineofilum sp.]|jgi:hypothetical protein|nr:hypothetical protein [Promineifilum sp.]
MKTKAVAWVFLCSLLLALAACALGADEGDKGGDLGEGGAEATGGGITWRREGGIAGFCDVVTITLPDEATVSSCASDPPQVREELELTAEQATRLQALIDSLASFDRETSDPGTADAMTITIVFLGRGQAQPSADDVAAIEALAAEVLQTANE